MSKIIDGKQLAQQLKDELKIKVLDFNKTYNRNIKLAVVLVGDNPASQVYVKNKIKATEYVGMQSLSFVLPQNSTQNDVNACVKALADDKTIDGILVQLPLPKGINEEEVLNLIPAEKDVDGFLAENIGNLAMNKQTTVACTPFGVMKMLESINYDLSGKNAVVVGRRKENA